MAAAKPYLELSLPISLYSFLASFLPPSIMSSTSASRFCQKSFMRPPLVPENDRRRILVDLGGDFDLESTLPIDEPLRCTIRRSSCETFPSSFAFRARVFGLPCQHLRLYPRSISQSGSPRVQWRRQERLPPSTCASSASVDNAADHDIHWHTVLLTSSRRQSSSRRSPPAAAALSYAQDTHDKAASRASTAIDNIKATFHPPSPPPLPSSPPTNGNATVISTTNNSQKSGTSAAESLSLSLPLPVKNTFKKEALCE